MVLHRVPADLPLYDILNEFQKGSSHMAAVVKVKNSKKKLTKKGSFPAYKEVEKKGFKDFHVSGADLERGLDSQPKVSDNLRGLSNRNGGESWNGEVGRAPEDDSIEGISEAAEAEDVENGDVIGIITMEDVMEELLQVS